MVLQVLLNYNMMVMLVSIFHFLFIVYHDHQFSIVFGVVAVWIAHVATYELHLLISFGA